MALIKCANCGHMISDRAVRCPKCGNEVVPQVGNFEIKVPQTPKKEKKIITIDEEKLKKSNWGKMSIAIAVCLIAVMAFVGYKYDFFAGFGIYGLISSLVVCGLLLWKGSSAIRYKTNGKSKLALYRLKSKWVTILIWFLGLSGVVSLGIDVYQGNEYNKQFGAKQCIDYAIFKAEAPLFVKWSYCKWNSDNEICAYSTITPYGKETNHWGEDVNEKASSAHLCSNNIEELQSILRLSIVRNMRNMTRGYLPNAILLGFNGDAHERGFTLHYDYDENVPVNVTIDESTLLEFKCPYTSVWNDGKDIWYALLVYGKQYETLLAKLKSGKTCTVKIGDVDKIYKFNVEGLEWNETIGNDVVAENEQEVVKMDSTKISYASEPIQQNKVTLTPNLISNVQQFEKLGTYSEGMALVQRNGKWGYINAMGNEVIPCQFEGEEYGGWGHNFSDGYAVVVIDGKHGYIDRSGNVVIAPIYEDAGDFSEGFACVSKMGHDKLVFINKEGKEIENLSNRYVWDWNIDRKLPKFQNGICKVHVELPKDKQSEGDWVEIKWINSKGEQVSPPQAKEESEELERYWVEENGISKVGYKNKQGDIVVRAKYTTIGGFSQGLAVATLQYGTSANDGEYFCIYGYVDMYNHDTFADEDFQRIENAYRNNTNL